MFHNHPLPKCKLDRAEIASIVKATETTEIVTESVGVKRGSLEITLVAESLGF